MPDHKIHHFVPRFHLRQFGGEKTISVFNVAARRHIADASIRTQCQRSYLYGKDGEVEAALCGIEGLACNVIRNLTNQVGEPMLSAKEHHDLLVFLLIQWMRTPSAARHALESRRLVLEGLQRPHPSEPVIVARTLLPFPVQEEPEPVRANLALAARSYRVLEDLAIAVICNESELEFITSDSPVVLFNQAGYGVRDIGTTGFTQSGLQILFPLSPNKYLLLYDRDVYVVGNGTSGRTTIRNRRDVERLNALQVLEAENNLYYSGAQETRIHIDELPIEIRRRREDTPRVGHAISADEMSILVHNYVAPHAHELRVSFMNMVRAVKRKRPLERVHNWRPHATAVAEMLNPRAYDEPRPDGPRVWRKLD